MRNILKVKIRKNVNDSIISGRSDIKCVSKIAIMICSKR